MGRGYSNLKQGIDMRVLFAIKRAAHSRKHSRATLPWMCANHHAVAVDIPKHKEEPDWDSHRRA